MCDIDNVPEWVFRICNYQIKVSTIKIKLPHLRFIKSESLKG